MQVRTVIIGHSTEKSAQNVLTRTEMSRSRKLVAAQTCIARYGLRTLEAMTLTSGSEIQRIVGNLLNANPCGRGIRVEPNVTAIITVQDDTRFFPDTLRAVLGQTVLPATILIADCSDVSSRSVRTQVMVEQVSALGSTVSERVAIQIVPVHHARSFGDAIGNVVRITHLDHTDGALWLLHDDSRPVDEYCLERLVEARSNTNTAAILGAKQLDWDGTHLHNVGAYAGRGCLRTLVVAGEPDQEQYDGRQDVFAVSLAGALVPVETLAQMRGVNPWFGTYSESADLCRRLCLSGRRVVVVPQARIGHRRARYDGLRTHTGEALGFDETADTSMSRLRTAQKYRYTDTSCGWWPFMWLASLFIMLGSAIRELFRKNPYNAWCRLCMPWIALVDIPGALSARHRIRAHTTVTRKDLAVLTADRQQIRQWKQATREFEDQQHGRILSPLAIEHLRHRRVLRWVWALCAALLAFGVIAVTYWNVLRSAWSGGSLYSDALAPTAATMKQLVASATTPWIFGAGTGVPAPPTPWLLVLMCASVITGGHPAAALSLIFFLAAPLSVLSFWALAGVVTRSDAVRTLAGLTWFALSFAWGLYAQANLPMLTVFVFLPAAFAFVFKSVGMYRTEAPMNSRPSIQAAAIAALLFMPVVAAEPQLLFGLIIAFVVFLLFVRRHRLRLLLIPFPAAFAVAPTILNAVRYGGQGMWRQLFGDIMLPISSANDTPQLLGLVTMGLRAVGIDAQANWMTAAFWTNGDRILAITAVVAMGVLLVTAVCLLARPSVTRAARMLWSLVIAGLFLAFFSAAIGIAVAPYGQAAGSLAPGLALSFVGILAAATMMAGSAVTQFNELSVRDDPGEHHPNRAPRITVGIILIIATALCAATGISRASTAHIGISSDGLPMVAQEYLNQNEDRRVLALGAESNTTVNYSVMRTGRGDLIDSSPVQRVRIATGHEVDPQNENIARIAGKLLGNADTDAIMDLTNMGFGGIYVVRDTSGTSTRATDQLVSNITSSDGTQAVVDNDQGVYLRLTGFAGTDQTIDTAWQRRTQDSAWRIAWLWCLGTVVVLYIIVAMPRRTREDGKEA